MIIGTVPESFAELRSLAIEGGHVGIPPADSSGVRVFKGIPYAAPPVDHRRWRAPAPVEPWRGVKATDRFEASCAQANMFPGVGDLDGQQSEDCLYLNVWTPAHNASERLPVLVWIHGGAFVLLSGNEPRLDGVTLARQGVIVVTFNYRLGVFGFLAHPDLTAESSQRASGNYGIMDQIAALSWVQRNIASFGGDPSRVAIGGNSSGATSVNVLMASPLAAGLFTRAIAQGGSAMPASPPNDGSPLPRAIEESKGRHFATSLGASGPRELRALPMTALVEASGEDWSSWGWNACIDGYVLPAPPLEVFHRRQQNDVPLLVGWSANEGAALGRATFGGDDESFAPQIAARFGARAPEILRLYPAHSREQERAAKAALAGEGFIAYPSWTWAVVQSRTGKQPVFVYKFEHPPPVPPGYGRQSMLGDPGAFHGGEMPYVFGTFARFADWQFAPADFQIAAGMQSYWIHFIASGDPNGGAKLPIWPAYQGPAPRRLHVDARGFHVLPDADRCRFEQLGRLAAAAPGSLSYRGMSVERWAP